MILFKLLKLRAFIARIAAGPRLLRAFFFFFFPSRITLPASVENEIRQRENKNKSENTLGTFTRSPITGSR